MVLQLSSLKDDKNRREENKEWPHSGAKHNALKVMPGNEKKRNLSSFQGLYEVNSHSGLSVMFSCPLMVTNEGRKVSQISAGPIEPWNTFSRAPLKAYYLFRPLSEVLMKTELKSNQRALKASR